MGQWGSDYGGGRVMREGGIREIVSCLKDGWNKGGRDIRKGRHEVGGKVFEVGKG